MRVDVVMPQMGESIAEGTITRWIKKVGGLWVEVPVLPNRAFLPNSFVCTKTGSSPLARILNTGEIDPLKLAVRLYRRQNLMEARGVPLDDVRQHYHARSSARLAVRDGDAVR